MTDVVNMFWHGGTLPPYAGACMRSFLNRGHRVRLFSYQMIEAPPGVTIADAGRILDPQECSRYPNIAALADAFRYALLFREGGWWVDVDVVCLTDRLPGTAYAWAEEAPGVLNNAILKFPQNDPLAARLGLAARQRSQGIQSWGALGPALLSELLEGFHPADRAGTTTEFYPLHWLEAPLLVLPEYRAVVVSRIENALFLHLWSQMFSFIGINPADAASGSVMHDLLNAGADGNVVPPGLWPRLRMRHAIRRYWGQRWVRRHWSSACCRLADRPPRVRYRHAWWNAP